VQQHVLEQPASQAGGIWHMNNLRCCHSLFASSVLVQPDKQLLLLLLLLLLLACCCC
jgi:hypothetical protein